MQFNGQRQHIYDEQAARSWRASGDRQISLSASARLQIFATKNFVFYNCKFLQQKPCFLQSQVPVRQALSSQ